MKNDNLSTLASTIKLGIENRLKELHTAMPGIIVSFDPISQLASVQPAIKRIFNNIDGDTEELVSSDLPILINVPVVYPRGGGYSITFPVAPGDECLLVFNERSIDSWHELGEVKDPAVKRFHDLSDAVCFIGLSSKPNKTPNYNNNELQLKSDNNNSVISIADNGIITLSSTNSIVLDTPLVHVTNDLQIDGEVTNRGVNISSTHVHEQGVDTGGDTQADTEVPK